MHNNIDMSIYFTTYMDYLNTIYCFVYRDLTNNHISFGLHGRDNITNETVIVDGFEGLTSPFVGLTKLHDLHLSYNNISAIGAATFAHVENLKVL